METQKKLNPELSKAMYNLKKSFVEFAGVACNEWDERLDKNYPFDRDFLEVVHAVAKWSESITEIVTDFKNLPGYIGKDAKGNPVCLSGPDYADYIGGSIGLFD